MPLALVFTFAVAPEFTVPPPFAVNVTVVPETKFPSASVTVTLSGFATAAFTGADCASPDVFAIAVALPAVTVSANVTIGVALCVVICAVTVSACALLPAESVVHAWPFTSVVCEVGLTELASVPNVPAVGATANETVAPCTADPFFTTAHTGFVNVVRACADCVVVPTACVMVVVFGNCTVTVNVSGDPVSPVDAAVTVCPES